MDSPNLLVPLAFALVLGLRHALDPDHLMAVSTLVAGTRESGTRESGTRRAARLGAIWGVGHALAIVVLGLPVVLAHAALPEFVQRTAETAIGVIIVLLAVRLLLRWRRGAFHVHAHDHDGERHVHLHTHRAADAHAHDHVGVRTPLQAFLIGVTHGVGGSAAVALLLLASVSDRGLAAAALVVFAAGTAASMGMLSAGFGWMLARRPVRERFRLAVVPLGVVGLGFGGLYAVAAWLPTLALV
jgi:ABC-type nickel/cobalt efflux system permease component RcnA